MQVPWPLEHVDVAGRLNGCFVNVANVVLMRLAFDNVLLIGVNLGRERDHDG